MSDLRTHFSGFLEGADLALDGAGLATDDGLETAVILSLFTDRRADPDDDLPSPGADPRGWWGDLVPLAPDYQLGSRLWLLSREKQTALVLERARFYAAEALAWLVSSGAASAVQVVATNPATGVLALHIAIDAPQGGAKTYTYQWEAMRNAV